METFNRFLKYILDENIVIYKKLTPSENEFKELISFGQENPDSYFVVAFYYLISNRHSEYLEYIHKSFENNSTRGYNCHGYYCHVIDNNPDEGIKWYKKAIDNKHNGAMINISINFGDQQNFLERDKYLDMAIENKSGKACYIKAINYKKDNDIENYNKYTKIGAKLGYCRCINLILDQYKQKKFSKYLKYLNILASYNYKDAKKKLNLIRSTEEENINENTSENINDNMNKNNILVTDLDQLYSHHKNYNNIEKVNELIKIQENLGSLGKLNIAYHLLNEKQYDKVLKMAEQLLDQNDVYGYIIMYNYLCKSKNNYSDGFEYLNIAKEIDRNNYILNFTLGMYYKYYGNDNNKALSYFNKSFDENPCIQNISELMLLHKSNKNYEDYLKYFKLNSKMNNFKSDEKELNWMVGVNDKNLALELAKACLINNLSIGISILINNDYSIEQIINISGQLPTNIIDKDCIECPICFNDTNYNVYLSCRYHKICLSCFKLLLNNKSTSCPTCNYKYNNFARELLLFE